MTVFGSAGRHGSDTNRSGIPIRLGYAEQASRSTLACLVAEGCNLLILDEPINHLDIPSRTQFEQALATFEGTVLAVVHDRYLIDQFASELWQVEDQTLRQIYLD